jgi:hypothetical protein
MRNDRTFDMATKPCFMPENVSVALLVQQVDLSNAISSA